MRTRILYLISSFAQGGAERHLLELVRCLDTSRFEPVIAVLRPDMHYETTSRIVLGGASWPASLGRLVATLRTVKPTILHCYLNDGNLWGRLAAQLAPIPRPKVLTSVHLDDMSIFYRSAERVLRRCSDRIVAHSESIRQLLVERLHVPDTIVEVIANGVDTRKFRPPTSAERLQARREYGLDDEFVAVLAGRICTQKNQLGVVSALARLRARGRLPARFQLVLAGRVSSQLEAQKLRYMIWRHRLAGHVRLVGPLQDVQRLLWAADLALLPSRTEASPLAALEAMATALPLVLTRASNTDRVLVDAAHGWEIVDSTPAAIATAIEQALATTAAQRAAMGTRARHHVESSFRTGRVAADFQRLYDRLAETLTGAPESARRFTPQ